MGSSRVGWWPRTAVGLVTTAVLAVPAWIALSGESRAAAPAPADGGLKAGAPAIAPAAPADAGNVIVLREAGYGHPKSKGEVIDLWPGKAPAEVDGIGPETVQPDKPGEAPVMRITNVTRPTITVFRPAKELDTGAAVVVAPGGGYNILAWDHEGLQVAAWLNQLGVTAAVLKYRVPRRPGNPAGKPPVQALVDAQRALSLVRAKAGDWGVDPARIGLLGFSAGGHLTAWAATNHAKRAYEKVDAVDEQPCRPAFTVLIYAGGIVGKDTLDLNPEITVDKDTPPAFLAHSADDRVVPANSIAYFLALRKAGVAAELHVYASGGHGYGMRVGPHAANTWPVRCGEWIKAAGYLRPASADKPSAAK